MRLIRLAQQSSRVADDIRAALLSLGRGEKAIGGIALIGARPTGFERVIEAIVVLPHGLLIVIGVDLPDPALELEAPLKGTWKADGWPLVGTGDAVNPATDALAVASSLTELLHAAHPAVAPIGTVIAVGPYVETVDHPAADLAGPVRVLYPTPTTMRAATASLATAATPCSVDELRSLLATLAPNAPEISDELLLAEGFRDTDAAPAEPPAKPPASIGSAAPTGYPAAAAPTAAGTVQVTPLATAGARPAPAPSPAAPADPPAPAPRQNRPAPVPPQAPPADSPAPAPRQNRPAPVPPQAPPADSPAPAPRQNRPAPVPPPEPPAPAPRQASRREVAPAHEAVPRIPPPRPEPGPEPGPPRAGRLAKPKRIAPAPTETRPPRGIVRWLPIAAIVLLLTLLVTAIITAINGVRGSTPPPPAPAPAAPSTAPSSASLASAPSTKPADSVRFSPLATGADQRCASHGFGDVQASLQETSCTTVRRASFDADIGGRQAAVTVAVIGFADAGQAATFKKVADVPGGGGITDIASETGKWPAPPVFERAAYTSAGTGSEIRLVQAAWLQGPSTPDDPALVSAAREALTLPVPG